MDNNTRIGDVFGRLVVTGQPTHIVDTSGKKRAVVPCRCQCGSEVQVRPYQLVHGISQSCGCLQRELISQRQTRHGDHRSQLYRKWASMIARCNNPLHQAFSDYGGRGIQVCDEWRDDYVSFRDWALSHGFEPSLSIDRIDNNGNYTPANCRWVTHTANNRNRRNSVLVTAFGEKRALDDWAADNRCSVNRSTIARRINAGWSPEAAIVTPRRRGIMPDRSR